MSDAVPSAEVDIDHQHGRIVRVTVGETSVAVYLDFETGVVTTPRGQFGIDVTGPWHALQGDSDE